MARTCGIAASVLPGGAGIATLLDIYHLGKSASWWECNRVVWVGGVVAVEVSATHQILDFVVIGHVRFVLSAHGVLRRVGRK